MRRSSSLPRTFAAPNDTSGIHKSGSLQRLSSGFKKLFGNNGRCIGDEERMMRKQAQALTKAYSADRLNIFANSEYCMGHSRRTRSAEELLLPSLDNSFAASFKEGPYVAVSNDIEKSYPKSPQSPALQTIDAEIPDSDQKGSRRSHYLIELDGILDEIARVGPRKLSNQIVELHRRISAVSVTESPAQDSLALSPLRPISLKSVNNDIDAAKIRKLVERYRFIREFSLVNTKEKPIVSKLMGELDQLVNGIESEDQTLVNGPSYDLRDINFPTSCTLLENRDELLSTPVIKSNERITAKDLSKNLVATRPQETINSFLGQGSRFGHEKTERLISSPACAIPPSNFRTLARLEYSNFVMDGFDDDDEMVKIEKTPTDPLILKVKENHRSCMQHNSTAIPLAFAELEAVIFKYSNIIDFGQGSSDPKSILLIPLNESCLPRWISPDSRLRIGRNSPWLQAKSLVISRNHCELFHDIDCFYVTDVGSTSGTFLNANRLSAQSVRSQPHQLRSGDILQLGIDSNKEADELGRLDLKFMSVQVLVLLGYNRKAIVPTQTEVSDVTELSSPRSQTTKLLSWKRIMNITDKIQLVPHILEGSNVRIWVDHGDILHSNSSGIAVVFYKNRPAFTAIYNNFKMNWEIAMTDSQGESILILDVLPGSSTVYSLTKGQLDMGRLRIITTDRIVIDPFQATSTIDVNHSFRQLYPVPTDMHELPSATDPVSTPFYTITVDPAERKMYFIQRCHNSRKQRLLGEAVTQLTKKTFWETQKYVLEARIILPVDYEALMVLGMLFTVLLQIELA